MAMREFHEVPGAFWAGYHSPINVISGEPVTLGQRASSIAMHIIELTEPPVPPKDLEEIVTESFFQALEPDEEAGYDPVHPAALEIMTMALNYSMSVYIWTIGDTGVNSPDDSELNPLGNCQLLKIEKGRIIERLENKVQTEKMRNLHIDTCAESKESSFREIIYKAWIDGVKNIYVADDLTENGEIVDKVFSEFQEFFEEL